MFAKTENITERREDAEYLKRTQDMRLFDLHCDTVYELYKKREGLKNNSCHIALDKSKEYDRYRQVLAIWSENGLSDEDCFAQYEKIIEYFSALKSETEEYDNFSYDLAVEGGKLLGKDMSRLYRLKNDGIKILTLVWGGECEIGGAHDTDIGLKPFGKDVVKECFLLGIVPDVSHSSDKTFFDTAEFFGKYGKSMIATHSNSRKIHSHKRNLSDEMFKIIVESGGVVGISLYPPHLCDGECDVDSVVRHIDHYMEIGGENSLCMGCDFDGVECLPNGISDISSLPKIFDRLKMLGYSDEICDRLFYKNAEEYFMNNIS